MNHHPSHRIPLNPFQRADLLSLGFGTTIAMWIVGYLCRLPSIHLPSALLFGLMIVCLLAGGIAAVRYTPYGWKGGLYTGCVAALLNLLVLGSLIGGDEPNQIAPTAAVWIPGSIVASAFVCALGAFAARSIRPKPIVVNNWTAVFSSLAALATFCLLLIGGVVTGQEAGLAVVDWPNSFGYNMFLYPLSKMTGGIYYEHTHRLFGSLVGLTTLFLAIHLQHSASASWIKTVGWIAFILVVIQGILGGLRVTGYFTLSTSPDETAPSTVLAVVHGVTGQLFFSLLASITLIVSPLWNQSARGIDRTRIAADRRLSVALFGILALQLILGAILRHTSSLLMEHITVAVFVITLTMVCGARAWGFYPQERAMQWFGLGLIGVVSLQMVLGLLALIAVNLERVIANVPTTMDIVLTTAHQGTGALLLALASCYMTWLCRLARQHTNS